MDLIYTNNQKIEQGIIKNYSLDFETSTQSDKNTFQIKSPLSVNQLNIGDYFYAEGTEYGGIVDEIQIDTSKKVTTINGRTWRGIIDSKIIVPPEGQAYYTVNGDANEVLAEIILKIDLADTFTVISGPANVNINYQFARYVSAYTGIIKMLSSYGLKLKIFRDNGQTFLSCVPITDYSNSREMTSDMFSFILQKSKPTCNHMIGLGSGELTERMVVHKYLQPDGSVTNTQYYFGVDEVVKVYDYSSVESLEELEKNTIEELEKCAIEDALSINSNNLDADLGDRFLARDLFTGIEVTEYIVNKIYNIKNNVTKINYEVGEQIWK